MIIRTTDIQIMDSNIIDILDKNVGENKYGKRK